MHEDYTSFHETEDATITIDLHRNAQCIFLTIENSETSTTTRLDREEALSIATALLNANLALDTGI